MRAGRLLILLITVLALAAPAHAAAGWAPTGSMGVSRAYSAAALLQDGRVLVTGGYTAPLATSSAELYDPATGAWSPAAPMTVPRVRHSMVTLADGKVLAAGGNNNAVTELASAELYDPATNTWQGVSDFAESRYDATLTLLADGRPLLASGNSYAQNRPTSWRYEPGTRTWSAAGSLVAARTNAAAALLPDGRVVVAAGRQFNTFLASTEIFDGNGWSPGPSLAVGRTYLGLTPLAGSRLLATGGSVEGNGVTASAEILGGSAWRPAGSMGTARFAHTQTTLANGKVLVAAGQGAGNAVLASTELYDPATDAWSPAGSLAVGRTYPAGVRLADGRVLVTGGWDPSGAATNSAELFTLPTSLGTIGAVGFDPQAVGRTAGAPLQVTNTGDAPLFVSGLALSGAHPGEFAVNGDRCRAVAVGATCIVDVSFTPAADGPRTAVLTFGANTAAATYAVALSGRGVADADGDGVNDANDRCRTLKGPASRQGCPTGLLADPSIRYRPSGKGIRVLAYYVKATTGARVTVSCSKRACKRTVTKGKGSKRVRITRLNNRRLTHGTKLTITVSKADRLTTTVVDRVSRGRRIEGRPRCTPVGC